MLNHYFSSMIRIPIKTHLFKFLVKKIPIEKIQITKPITSSDDPLEHYNRIAYKCLNPFLRADNGFNLADITFKHYELILFIPSDGMIQRGRVHLAERGVYMFNNVLRDEFINECRMFVDKAISNTGRHDIAILNFMDMYGIDEEDIRFDSIKKALYRDRLSFVKNNNNMEVNIGVIDFAFQKKLAVNFK